MKKTGKVTDRENDTVRYSQGLRGTMREPAILLVAMTDRDSGFDCDKDSDS